MMARLDYKLQRPKLKCQMNVKGQMSNQRHGMVACPGATRKMSLSILTFCHRRLKTYSNKARSGPGNGLSACLLVNRLTGLQANQYFQMSNVKIQMTNECQMRKFRKKQEKMK